MSKFLFGKIFISYSSLDKTVARKISARLKKEGYYIWLDEMDLKLGDKLTKEISTALAQAKIVIILVSENSLKSSWFDYEINIATERMIKEKIRLIPLLIDKVSPPENLKGIQYGDLKKFPKKTWAKLISAINSDYEKFNAASELNKLSQYTRKIFGSIGYTFSLEDNPFSKGGNDYEIITINVDGKEYEVIYTELRAYSAEKILTYYDWSKYVDMLGERGWNAQQEGQFSLLVTTYKISDDLKNKMTPITLRSSVIQTNNDLYMLADLSNKPSGEESIKVLQSLKTYFENYIRNTLKMIE